MTDIQKKIYTKYENKWVALNENGSIVLASGLSIIEVEQKLKKERIKAFEIKYIYPTNVFLSPYAGN